MEISYVAINLNKEMPSLLVCRQFMHIRVSNNLAYPSQSLLFLDILPFHSLPPFVLIFFPYNPLQLIGRRLLLLLSFEYEYPISCSYSFSPRLLFSEE